MCRRIALILAFITVTSTAPLRAEDPPKADQPKAEEPKKEEPKAEEPKAEEPKKEEPKKEEPKTEEPKKEEPKKEEPPKFGPGAKPPMGGGPGGGGFGGGGMPNIDKELLLGQAVSRINVTRLKRTVDLTAEQEEKIKELLREYGSNFGSIPQPDESGKIKLRNPNEIHTEAVEKIKAMLTDEQKPKFDEYLAKMPGNRSINSNLKSDNQNKQDQKSGQETGKKDEPKPEEKPKDVETPPSGEKKEEPKKEEPKPEEKEKEM